MVEDVAVFLTEEEALAVKSIIGSTKAADFDGTTANLWEALASVTQRRTIEVKRSGDYAAPKVSPQVPMHSL